jgi:ribosomal protein L12E/L44/L45/RPP1/RPP2
MATSTEDEDRLKELLKAAIVEVLEERRDLVRELIEEALEDVALARAIEEGQESPLVSRDEVFKILRSVP